MKKHCEICNSDERALKLFNEGKKYILCNECYGTYSWKEIREKLKEPPTIADCSKCVKNFCGFYWKHQKEFDFNKHGNWLDYLKSIKCPFFEEREISDWGTKVPIM